MVLRTAIKYLSALIFAACASGAIAAEELPVPPLETAALPPSGVALSGQEQALPGVLTPDDAKLYDEIFRLQEAGHWRRADKLIKRLQGKASGDQS